MSNKGCYERTKRVLTWLSVRRHHWEGCPKCWETHRAILRRLDVTSVEWRRGTVKNRLKGQECVEAAEKGSSALTCFTGPWADAERGQKRAIFLHYSSCDCGRGGGWGRSYSLCQNHKGTEHNTHGMWGPRCFPKANSGSLGPVRAQAATVSRGHSWVSTPGGSNSHARPAACSWASTPSRGGECAGCCLSLRQTGSDEASATAPCASPIWPDHSCGIDIMEDYSCQLQV